MAIAVTPEHQELAATADDFLSRRKARVAARASLDTGTAHTDLWAAICALGWPGLHLAEAHGGSGFGLPELVVVLEQCARHLAPVPLLPTAAASAAIAAAESETLATRVLPGLADGNATAALALSDGLTLTRSGDGSTRVDGILPFVPHGAAAQILVLAAGEDLIVVDANRKGVVVTERPSLDPTRPHAEAALRDVHVAPDEILHGARARATALWRVLAAAEAAGGARECADAATAYAKERVQFGRPIGTFQAVKHHCANMLVAAELAAAAVWDAARAAEDTTEAFALAAAVATATAIPAFTKNASLNIQVHGGIGFTWEHDAHLYQRRALTLSAITEPDTALVDIHRLRTAGVTRAYTLDLPPEAEQARAGIRADIEAIAAAPEETHHQALADSGYLVAHWPKPFGRAAAAAEQLVIDEELERAGITQPALGITQWVLLTMVQHGTPDQIERLVRPALHGEHHWCQLFSEPDAGSDAAGIRTRARRTEGGWLITGQKVWTSGAHTAAFGLATVRTDPDAPKHRGVTTMAIDMRAPGVEVRPLRMATGHSEFNEVFLNDVFVPDADVIGEVDQGWTVARATMGNERVSIGGGHGGGTVPLDVLELTNRLGDRLPGAEAHCGSVLAEEHVLRLLNVRGAERAVSGIAPGPEGNISKLVLAEYLLHQSEFAAALHGPEAACTGGAAAETVLAVLSARGMAIAGGTSEITRNQIAERILGLPRDPLLA
ncbi:acyl-CoA dehydrogenase [Streptomyces sp. A1499]|uniref:acyl-CoA dehydrogenase n=1 Tax=Streptomyces sp. A1499 TaxID=2563104 RepID=UPI00109E723F|nr:acyl-CoA dehydrogenase [Streptomyces sp. A1499]THC43108.1 acyl-CoA dehydrogenase [Streptomyces sp. A1499]